MINYKQLFEASNAQNWNFKQYLHQLRDMRVFDQAEPLLIWRVINIIKSLRADLTKTLKYDNSRTLY